MAGWDSILAGVSHAVIFVVLAAVAVAVAAVSEVVSAVLAPAIERLQASSSRGAGDIELICDEISETVYSNPVQSPLLWGPFPA